MTLKTSKRSGNLRKTISVLTDDPDKPNVKLTVKANVETEFDLKPPRAHFYNVKKDSTYTKRLEIVSRHMDTLEILSIEPDNEFIEARIIREGTKKMLEVTLRPGHPIGYIRSEILLKTNLDPHPEHRLPVRGQVVGYIRLEPPRILFKIYSDTPDTAKTILVSRPGKPGFRIREIAEETGIIRWELSSDDVKEEYSIDIILNRDKVKGNQINSALVIRTNDPDEPELKVPIRGFIKDYPSPIKTWEKKKAGSDEE